MFGEFKFMLKFNFLKKRYKYRSLGYKGRSIYKGLNIIKYIRNHQINSRTRIILNKDVNKQIYVHTGKFLKKIYIKRKYVGHKLGEFGITKDLGNKIHFRPKKKKKQKVKRR